MDRQPDILIVDDDVTVIHALRTMLQDLSPLRFARSGEDALRLCRAAAPDLVLLDVHMDGMDGLEAGRRLREDPELRHVPLIYVTGDASEQRHLQALDLGAQGWIAKPLEAARVRSRVRAALRQALPGVAADVVDGGEARARPVVLVVDDDVNAVQALDAALTPMGVECIFALDGHKALALARSQRPDLVLLEAQMPGIDGFAVAEQMLQDPALGWVPLVFVTRFADVQTEARALDVGATDFIAKPYSEPVLQARVRNVLRLKQRTDEALRAEREHWQRVGESRIADIVSHASDAILTLDAAGRVVLFNDAAAALFGRSAEQVVGAPAGAWVPFALPAGLLDGAPPPTREQPVHWSDAEGRARSAELAWSVIGSGRSRLATLVLRDTGWREAAEREARERLRLETESRTKTMMMSYLAHEVGNPLNAMLGFAGLLDTDLAEPLTPGQRRQMHHILRCGQQLRTLLRDVLDVARFEAGRLHLELGPVRLEDSVRAAFDLTGGQARGAGIELLAPAATSIRALADRSRLHQCLVNLLTNAIKYNRPGGRVEVRLRVEDRRVAVEVADSGLGMSADQLQHLFEPFNRLGRQTAPGQGLGLVVTRMLTTAMGGELAVYSEPQVGSRFVLWLPRAGETG